MSKIATLKSLPTPSELRQSVQQLQSLEHLPELVAHEVSKSLAPLHLLQEEVHRALSYYDQINQAQRSSLEQMAQELGNRAIEGMEVKTAALAAVIEDLSKQSSGLQASMKALQSSTSKLSALPADLTKTTQYSARLMQNEAKELIQAAHAARPTLWRTLGLLLAAAVLGSLLVAAGQVGLNRLLPPTATERDAEIFRVLWAKATPEERALMNQIVSKPAK